MSNIGNKKTFSKNLTYYIERSGKMQTEIADAIGVSKSTLTEWTKARKYPRIDKIELLANYFSIQKSDLIEEKLSDETKKDNDVLTDFIVKARMSDDIMYLVESINCMNKDKLELLRHYLDALNK
jgi:transcriptional regulator with XRE-family HTH domain